ncbi:hypothetical protein D3C85_1238410 [compost metagenome]
MGQVLAQLFQVVRYSIRVVEQMFQRLTINTKLLGDEGVVSVRPRRFFLRPFEVLLLLQVHKLADAERAVGECPAHTKQAAAIDFRDA